MLPILQYSEYPVTHPLWYLSLPGAYPLVYGHVDLSITLLAMGDIRTEEKSGGGMCNM